MSNKRTITENAGIRNLPAVLWLLVIELTPMHQNFQSKY